MSAVGYYANGRASLPSNALSFVTPPASAPLNLGKANNPYVVVIKVVPPTEPPLNGGNWCESWLLHGRQQLQQVQLQHSSALPDAFAGHCLTPASPLHNAGLPTMSPCAQSLDRSPLVEPSGLAAPAAAVWQPSPPTALRLKVATLSPRARWGLGLQLHVGSCCRATGLAVEVLARHEISIFFQATPPPHALSTDFLRLRAAAAPRTAAGTTMFRWPFPLKRSCPHKLWRAK